VDISTASPEEVARFTAMADAWWDPDGKFKTLHMFNPVRLSFLRSRLAAHFGRDPEALRPFEGLSLLDVGCGGGLIAEPMAEMGFSVTGIDAGEKNVGTAAAHAAQSGVKIDYRTARPEMLAEAGESFDVVLTLEIVEHVADLDLFLAMAAKLVKPNGTLVGATINRTPKAWLLAIVGAEYVLRWLPRGTHDWHKFVKPSEFAAHLRHSGLELSELKGMSYNPISQSWSLTADVDVNYLLLARKNVG
jgi:2-polyprenyl-6-hydroxyphenyl methylase/3-demethylubiquinone-9 3-methyltransferase